MTNSESCRRAEALFKAALERPAEERAAFLAEAAAGDAELQKEVTSLLAHFDAAGTFLEKPPVAPSAAQLAMDLPSGQSAACRLRGQRIGSYEIRDLLAEGGMGVVYLARQDHPPRPVALKLLRPGLATAAMLRRFEHEAEVLGRLQHPGIAQILEAGTAETGYGPQPFFAMELIEGQPLTDYAESHRLSHRQRLELLAKVCEAVQHAHQKGVIHRDLKPANILVDAAGQPKVLDFGVARVTDADLQTATLHTSAGQLLGTIPYMSPEQVAGDPRELDTRSDVYALGVVGYELLTGRLPYGLEGKHLTEAVRAITEDPPAPLTSVSRVFRGDLETIFRKALEKDKNRRYASASAFSADLRCYLRAEPIAARPPSTLYQLGKLARRHKGLTSGLALSLLCLVAGVIAATAYALAAKRSEAEARRAQMEAQKHRTLAERARDESDRVSNFLGTMLAAVNPARVGREVRVKDILDEASKTIAGQFPDQPLVESYLRNVLGMTYSALGDYSLAETHLRRALELRRGHLDSTHPDVAMSLYNLAYVLCQEGDYAQAEAFYRQALVIAKGAYGDEDCRVARILSNLGAVLEEQGRQAEAEAFHRQAVDAWYKRGDDGAAHARGLTRLGRSLVVQGEYAEAESLFREALAWQRHWFGEEHIDIAGTLNELGLLRAAQGDHAEAEVLLRQALATRRRLLGDEHADVATTLDNLAARLRAQGDEAGAEPLLRQALDIRRKRLGARHPALAKTLNDLAALLETKGAHAEAQGLLSEAAAIDRLRSGEARSTTGPAE